MHNQRGRTALEQDFVFRRSDRDGLLAVVLVLIAPVLQSVAALVDEESVHIVGTVEVDVHGAVAAVDAGNGVVGQALFVKTVGHVDAFALLAAVGNGFLDTVGLPVSARAVPLKATREDNTTADNSFILISLKNVKFETFVAGRGRPCAKRAHTKTFPLKRLMISDNFCKGNRPHRRVFQTACLSKRKTA